MNTTDKVVEVLSFQLGVNRDSIDMDSRLEDDLGCDSLDCIEIMMQLEDEQSIEIDDGEIEKVKTVQDVINLVDAKLTVKAEAEAATKSKEGAHEI